MAASKVFRLFFFFSSSIIIDDSNQNLSKLHSLATKTNSMNTKIIINIVLFAAEKTKNTFSLIAKHLQTSCLVKKIVKITNYKSNLIESVWWFWSQDYLSLPTVGVGLRDYRSLECTIDFIRFDNETWAFRVLTKSEIDFLSCKLISFVTYANFLLTNSKEIKVNKENICQITVYVISNWIEKKHLLKKRTFTQYIKT